MAKIKLVLLFLSFGTMVIAQEKQRDSIRKQMLFSDTVPKKLSLTEIVVKGKKPPVSFKIDRQVFRASEYANAANGNAIYNFWRASPQPAHIIGGIHREW